MPSKPRAEDALFPSWLLLQVLMVILAVAQWHQPALAPLKVLVVLLHEMSHGLMALATGGTVQELVIAADETGSCRTLGGNDLLIVSAGYLGSMFFGGLLLTASRSRPHASALLALLALCLFGAALTVVRDEYTRRFAFATAGAALLVGFFTPAALSGLVLRAIGTFSSLYVLFDIYSDILSPQARELGLQSDAMAFTELTEVPPAAVGLAWLVISLGYFLVMARHSLGSRATTRAAPPIASRRTAPVTG